MRTALVLVVVVVALGACKQQKAKESAPTTGPVYRVDVAPPEACKVGQTCAVRARLTALGGFHVNREYPFKFVPSPTDGVEHDAGAFAIETDETGTLTVTFRPTAAGTAHVAGSFKLSVCSADTCEIERAPIAVDVPVT